MRFEDLSKQIDSDTNTPVVNEKRKQLPSSISGSTTNLTSQVSPRPKTTSCYVARPETRLNKNSSNNQSIDNLKERANSKAP
jgi:hypothetical protein